MPEGSRGDGNPPGGAQHNGPPAGPERIAGFTPGWSLLSTNLRECLDRWWATPPRPDGSLHEITRGENSLQQARRACRDSDFPLNSGAFRNRTRRPTRRAGGKPMFDGYATVVITATTLLSPFDLPEVRGAAIRPTRICRRAEGSGRIVLRVPPFHPPGSLQEHPSQLSCG